MQIVKRVQSMFERQIFYTDYAGNIQVYNAPKSISEDKLIELVTAYDAEQAQKAKSKENKSEKVLKDVNVVKEEVETQKQESLKIEDISTEHHVPSRRAKKTQKSAESVESLKIADVQ